MNKQKKISKTAICKNLQICLLTSLIFTFLHLNPCLTVAQIANSSNKDLLGEIVYQVTKKVVSNWQFANRDIMISPTDFYERDSQLSLPLSIELRDRFRNQFENNGFNIIKPNFNTETVWILECEWYLVDDKIMFNFKAHPIKDKKRRNLIVISKSIRKSAINENFLKADMPTYARTLVKKLSINDKMALPENIYLRPVKVIKRKKNSMKTRGMILEQRPAAKLNDQVSGTVGGENTNEYFNILIQDAIAQSNLLIPVDAAVEFTKIKKNQFKTRGMSIKDKPQLSLTSDLLDVKNELTGEIYIEPETIIIQAELTSRKRGGVISASVEFPADLLPPDISTKSDPNINNMLTASTGASLGGLSVELSTTRGEGKTLYHQGEKVRFLIRLNKAAYIYLFNINSNKEALLLYPARGMKPEKLQPDNLILLPDDYLSYEIIISPPFGKDVSWVVASENPLPLPAKLEGEWKNSSILKGLIRDLGEKSKAGYAEAQVLVTTAK
jgi:hypothetical protein